MSAEKGAVGEGRGGRGGCREKEEGEIGEGTVVLKTHTPSCRMLELKVGEKVGRKSIQEGGMFYRSLKALSGSGYAKLFGCGFAEVGLHLAPQLETHPEYQIHMYSMMPMDISGKRGRGANIWLGNVKNKKNKTHTQKKTKQNKIRESE